VKILFAEAAAEAFAELPQSTKRKAAGSIELLEQHPRMYPVRRRGLMRGYRHFAAGRHLVYYSVNSQEVRITAIIPGAMRRA
jgi:plasmid stabilization system protein ParE